MSSYNPRLLIVGPKKPERLTLQAAGVQGIYKTVAPNPVTALTTAQGPPPDFNTIQEAIDAAADALRFANRSLPLDKWNFMDRYTVLVTPGVYHENIVLHPHVNVMGVSKESVYIYTGFSGPKKPAIRLASLTNVSNLTILNPANMPEEVFAITNRIDNDFGPQSMSRFLRLVGIGITNVDVFVAGDPRQGTAGVDWSLGKALELRGNWTTAILTQFGASYYGQEFPVVLFGPTPNSNPHGIDEQLRGATANGWNADCHLMQCFFDSLFVREESGGCIAVADCHEVHIRNSHLRTTAIPGGAAAGAAVRISSSSLGGENKDYFERVGTLKKFPRNYGQEVPLVEVSIEGSSLYCPGGSSPRIIHVTDRTSCAFNYSTTHSLRLPRSAANYAFSVNGLRHSDLAALIPKVSFSA